MITVDCFSQTFTYSPALNASLNCKMNLNVWLDSIQFKTLHTVLSTPVCERLRVYRVCL